MGNLKPISKELLEETIYDGEPIENFRPQTDATPDIFDKLVKLTGWYHKYNLKTHKNRIKKLNKLLGKPLFKGKKLNDIGFYLQQNIWGYSYLNDDDMLIFVYYNREGLSIELTGDCEEHIPDILDELDNMLSK